MKVQDNIPLHETMSNIVIKRIEKNGPLNFDGIHRHSFYELLYFSEAEDTMVHSIDFKEITIRTDCIYLIKPGQVHHIIKTNQKGYLIAIKPEYLNSFYHNFNSYLHLTLPDEIVMDKNDLHSTIQIIKLLEHELSLKSRKDLIGELTSTLISQLILAYNENIKKSNIDKRVLKLVALIDQYYLTEREVAFYANEMSLSEKRLGVLSKHSLGHTVKGLIQQRILLEAKRLISLGTLSFKSISFELRFIDASYFSRFFKKYANMTPEEFKVSLK